MWLKCKKGHEWDYKGQKKDYASCSICRSKISIKRARARYLAAEEVRVKRRQAMYKKERK